MGMKETCIILDHFRDPVIDPLNDSWIFSIKIRQRNIIISEPTLPLSLSARGDGIVSRLKIRERRWVYVFTTGLVGKVYRTVRMIFFCFIERDEMRVIDVLEVECRTANNAKSVDCNVKHQVLAPVLVVFPFAWRKRR